MVVVHRLSVTYLLPFCKLKQTQSQVYSTRGESARRRTSQWANEPRGEQAMWRKSQGRTGKGAKKP